jgi:hypothetical protein
MTHEPSNAPRFDATEALAPLRDFQRRTVDHVFTRLFEDPDPVYQFLVADEVGLGKTMVARGVVAKTIARLWDTVDRIDVLYICSNQAIARQNLSRLNVLPQSAVALPTRITLLPLQMQGATGLSGNKVNFISLTPGTTFELKSSTGIAQERALIVRMLADPAPASAGLCEMLRVWCEPESWLRWVKDIGARPLHETLAAEFRARVAAVPSLSAEIEEMSERYAAGADAVDDDARRRRDALIGRLRGVLAKICVAALEPDLVILDEFQRFHDLLHGDDDAALLAQQIFGFMDDAGNVARTLLLSATPYRMLTLDADAPEDGAHHEDFLSTLRFLFGPERGAAAVQDIDAEMRRMRAAMLGLPGAFDAALEAKTAIEIQLRQVIARTERVDFTADRDSMMSEPPIPTVIEPRDLQEAVAVSAVARAAGESLPVDYWKSTPYLLNFIGTYALKRRLEDLADAPPAALVHAFKAARPFSLRRATFDAYKPLHPTNGRMRALMVDMFDRGLARRLWMPPSRPYFGDPQPASKALVFSTWTMTPDAISGVLSYEAERRMGAGADEARYFAKRRVRPLQFRRADGRLAGLRAMLLAYPSPTLAAVADPLDILGAARRPLTEGELRAAASQRLRPLLAPILAQTDDEAETATWEWAAPAAIDVAAGKATLPWLRASHAAAQDDDEPEGGNDGDITAHFHALADIAETGQATGAPDFEEALELLVDIALGSPAICALRALRRAAPDRAWDDPLLLTAAAKVASGFRTLYNQHDAVALLRAQRDGPYWHAALSHGARHDLQAVLDEYAHVLCEAEGLVRLPSAARIKALSEKMVETLSLRPAQIVVDDIRVRHGRLTVDKSFKLRGRFAMRLSGGRDEDGAQSRVEAVRAAFNSPFHPFVLASTSIGQEGLDFHHYCHRVWHWNLPSNPVDMEQREGRVHRYKGHAIRRNVAASHGHVLLAPSEDETDPWTRMFAAAEHDAPDGAALSPWWIHEGPARIERCVPLPPFSREVSRLAWLKRSVAIYRLAFGQPRQDDLLAWLADLGDALPADRLAALQISLRPKMEGAAP